MGLSGEEPGHDNRTVEWASPLTWWRGVRKLMAGSKRLDVSLSLRFSRFVRRWQATATANHLSWDQSAVGRESPTNYRTARLQRISLTCGREEGEPDYAGWLPRARTVLHIR